jgi:hypothetical protein
MRMAKQRKTWVFSPPKPPTPPVPDDLQAEVERKAGALVEEFLKPQFLKPPPKNWRWNCIIDIHSKCWPRRSGYCGPADGSSLYVPTFCSDWRECNPADMIEKVGGVASTSARAYR